MANVIVINLRYARDGCKSRDRKHIYEYSKSLSEAIYSVPSLKIKN